METWIWVLCWILSILTIAGNGFIIFLVSSNRQFHTKTNSFIVSLAAADFCLGASVVPSEFFCDMTSRCNWPRRWLSWAYLIKLLFGYASVLNLCSLVLDRYTAVVKPLKYVAFVTGRCALQMIFCSWLIPFGFVIIFLLLVLYTNRSVYPYIIGPLVVFFEVVSCCTLIFCFSFMVIVVYKQTRSAATLAKQLRFNHRGFTPTAHDKSAVAMMAIVVGIFLVCYAIFLRCSFIRLFRWPSKCNDSDYKLTFLVLNSTINPWAYAFFKRDIKRELRKRLLMCKVYKVTSANGAIPLNSLIL